MVKSWTEVLRHLCIRWAFFNLHTPIPSPTEKKRWTYVNFSEYQLSAGWMKEELQENFEKEDKQKVQKIMNAALLSQGILSRIVAARK